MFQLRPFILASLIIVAPTTEVFAKSAALSGQTALAHTHTASALAGAQLSSSAHMGEMVRATLGVAMEHETTASRFVGRVLGAFGIHHRPRMERTLAGSGVVVDKDHGIIATSAHLFGDEGRIVVTIYDDLLGEKLPQEVTGEIAAIDEESHVMLVAVAPDALRYTHKATWGHAQALDLDDVVICISSSTPYKKERAVGIIVDQDVSHSVRAHSDAKEMREDHLFVASTGSNAQLTGVGPGAPVFAHRGPLVGIVTVHTAGLLYAVPFERIAPLVERAVADREIDFPGMP